MRLPRHLRIEIMTASAELALPIRPTKAGRAP